MSQESDFSVHASEQQKSAASAFLVTVRSVQQQAPPTNPCLVRQVPAQLHQLSPYTLSSCMASSSSLSDLTVQFFLPTPDYMGESSTPGCMVESPSFSAHPCFKCSAQRFLSDLIASLSYGVLLLPVLPHLLPSLAAIFSQGKSSP